MRKLAGHDEPIGAVRFVLPVAFALAMGCGASAQEPATARERIRRAFWQAYQDRLQAELSRECLRGYLIGGDARCPYRRRIERTITGESGALAFAEPRSSVGLLACGVSEGQLACASTYEPELPERAEVAVTRLGPRDLWASGYRTVCVARGGLDVECWFGGVLHERRVHGDTEHFAVGRLPAPASEIEAGYVHACARLDDGSVWCWDSGPYRRPTATDAARLRRLSVPAAASLYVGAAHACVVTREAELWCWGSLGVDWIGFDSICVLCNTVLRGEPLLRAEPARLATQVRIAAVSAERICAVDTGGDPRCWDGYHGGCMSDSQDRGPTPVPELAGSSELALSHGAICGRDGRRVRCVLDGTALRAPPPGVESTRALTEIELAAPATTLWANLDVVCASTEGGGRACWRQDDLAPAEWLSAP